MSAAIRAEGLRKVYTTDFWKKPVTGLVKLDLEVQRGEIFGFIGPNGAGKTTTIKILTGLQRATAGRAWILGEPVEHAESRRRLGFLPERPYFYEHLTATEVLDFYGQLFDLPRDTRRARIGRLLERVALGRFADVPLRKYSKGMLQRVGLCQALLHDPELVILDEPMSGLDPVGRAMVRDIILEERDAGRTVFFSSHILSDVSALCDRVGIVVGGELRGVGTLSQLIGDRVRYVECQIAGADEVSLPGTTRGVDAGVRTVRCAPDEVDALIDAARRAGGRILQVQPVRESLEDVLLTEVERAVPVDQARLGVLS